MSATSHKDAARVVIAKDGSIPRTTLKIPMPAGAKPPPAPASTVSTPPNTKAK